MGLSERKPAIGEVSLERMARAVEKVRIRLLRAASALEQAKVAYDEPPDARSQPQMGGIDWRISSSKPLVPCCSHQKWT